MLAVCNYSLRPAAKFENNSTKLGMKTHKSPIKGDLCSPCLITFSGAQERQFMMVVALEWKNRCIQSTPG